MKTQPIRFVCGLLLVVGNLLACQKTTDDLITPGIPGSPGTPTPGVIYDKGTPIGQPVQKTIGPEGGTLTSADGALSMTVPSGAVDKATVFTVQPVTPTLPNLIGQQAYRLLPEGQTFAQPVTLRYQYHPDSLDGTSAQLIFMAYQGNDGYWKALLDTELDENARTLTVKTRHFSDWGAFAEFVLKADRNVLAPGESAKLTLSGFTYISPELSNEAIEIPLARVAILSDTKNIKNWQVKGKGSLAVEDSQTMATYSAPEDAAGSSALISVEVYNFIPSNLRPRQGATGKAVMLKKIGIQGTYFEATIDGQRHELMPGAFMDRHGIMIYGVFSKDKSLAVQIRSRNVTPSSTIRYGVASGELDGAAMVSLSDGSPWPWITWFPTCSGGDYGTSDGSVHIDSYDIVNGKRFIRGSLTATVYGGPDNCLDLQSKKVSARFNMPLTGG